MTDTALYAALPSWTAAAKARRRAVTLATLERLERECSELARETGDIDAAVEIGKSCRHMRKALKRLGGEK